MSIYLFGYGALLDLKTIKEIERPENKKICPVMVKGLKRSLNVGGGKKRVMGVKEVSTAQCNGILFKVTESELEELIQREKLYTIKTLAKSRIEFTYKKCLEFKPGDQILCFYPQSKYILKKNELSSNPISLSYLSRCKSGAAAISDDFLRDFLSTTHGL
jgi:hypothetical protein